MDRIVMPLAARKVVSEALEPLEEVDEVVGEAWAMLDVAAASVPS